MLMLKGGISRQETLDLNFVQFDARQEDEPARFDLASPGFTVSGGITELSRSRLTFSKIEIYLQLTDHCRVTNVIYLKLLSSNSSIVN